MKKRKTAGLSAMCMVLCLMLAACSSTTGVTTAAQTTAAATTTTAAVQETTTTAAAEIALPPTTTSIVYEEPEIKDQTWQQHTEPVTLTIVSGITRSLDMESYPLWGEDEISRAIMDMTGVQLEILEDGVEIDAALVSKELPDLFAVRAGINNVLENSAWCYPLNELAEQYCPDFFDSMDELEVLNNTALDGNVYTIRSGGLNSAVFKDGRVPLYPTYVMSVRTEVLDQLDADMPQTVEELEALLYAARDIEAKKPIVPYRVIDVKSTPLAGWMGVNLGLYWDQEGKTVRTPLRQQAWVEYLQMMNRWYRDGVLTMPEMTEEGAVNRYSVEGIYLPEHLWYAGHTSMLSTNKRSFVSCSGVSDIAQLMKIRDGAEHKEGGLGYELITSPLVWQGEIHKGTIYDQDINYLNGWPVDNVSTCLFITQQCSSPDRALYFYQFLLSDVGTKLTHWGIEGKQYELNEMGAPIFTEEYRFPAKGAGATIGRFGGSRIDEKGVYYWTFAGNRRVEGMMDAAADAFADNWDSVQLRQQLIDTGRNYKQYVEESWMPVLEFAVPEERSDEGALYRSLMAHWDMKVYEIVTQAADNAEVTGMWNVLMHEMETMGLDELEMYMTERFGEHLPRYQEAGYFTDIQIK